MSVLEDPGPDRLVPRIVLLHPQELRVPEPQDHGRADEVPVGLGSTLFALFGYLPLLGHDSLQVLQELSRRRVGRVV